MSQTFTDDCYDANHVAAVDLQAFEDNFAALKSAFSGTSAPSNPMAGMWWYDTTAHILKMRNEANNAWLSVWDLANNKPVVANLSNEITGAMIASAIKDPAAGTAGLRTLGTGANQALAGDTAMPFYAACHGDVVVASGGYVKCAEIKIKLAGTYRVSFVIHSDEGSMSTAWGRIYKNGAAVGTQRSTASASWVQFTENISFIADDLCQLYCYAANVSYPGAASGFRVDGINAPQVQAVSGGMY
jgi:hypothetical protein